MKRKSALFALTLITCLLFCACAENNVKKNQNSAVANTDSEKVVAYEIGTYDDADGGKHSKEYPLWSQEKYKITQDKSPEEKMSVSFEGKTYEGKYHYSTTEGFNTYKSDFYDYDGGYFSVNSSDNKLLSIVLPAKQCSGYAADNGELLKIADSVAKKYIDLEKYSRELVDGEATTSFVYKKTVCGIDTSDSLSITLDKSGNILSLSMSTNSFNDDLLPSIEERCKDLSSKEAESIIKQKTREIYAGKKISDLQIKQKILVMNEKGKVRIVYSVSLDISSADEDTALGTATDILLI